MATTRLDYCDEHKATIAELKTIKERLEQLESTRNVEWPRFWSAINARIKAGLFAGIFVTLIVATIGAWAHLANRIGGMELALSNRLTTLETKMTIIQQQQQQQAPRP